MSKELEDLYIIKGICQHLRLLSTREQKAFKNIEKELKALEIIKKLHIFDGIEWEDYENLDEDTKLVIAKEEYDLLREVLDL